MRGAIRLALYFILHSIHARYPGVRVVVADDEYVGVGREEWRRLTELMDTFNVTYVQLEPRSGQRSALYVADAASCSTHFARAGSSSRNGSWIVVVKSSCSASVEPPRHWLASSIRVPQSVASLLGLLSTNCLSVGRQSVIETDPDYHTLFECSTQCWPS